MSWWTFEHWIVAGYFFGVVPLVGFLWWYNERLHARRLYAQQTLEATKTEQV